MEEGKAKFSGLLRASAHSQGTALETPGRTRKDFDGFGAGTQETGGAEVIHAQHWLIGDTECAHMNHLKRV